jgi:hypothetical protein
VHLLVLIICELHKLYLHNYTITQRGLRVNLTDLGMAISKIQLLNLLMDLLLPNDRLGLTVWSIQTTVNKGRVIVVKPETWPTQQPTLTHVLQQSIKILQEILKAHHAVTDCTLQVSLPSQNTLIPYTYS